MNKSVRQYYLDIENQRRLGGTAEQQLRPAFHALVKSLLPSGYLLSLENRYKSDETLLTVIPDVTIKTESGVIIGYIEDKDPQDDLLAEINDKFSRGYARDNILFENAERLVLYQEGEKVDDVDISEAEDLQRAIEKLVGYKPQEVVDYEKNLGLFKENILPVTQKIRALIKERLESSQEFKTRLESFTEGFKRAVSPSFSEEDAVEILVEHVLSEDIFSSILGNKEMHDYNPVARSLNEIERILFERRGQKQELLQGLHGYYDSLNEYSQRLTAEQKQDLLKVVYQTFYNVYDPKKADTNGVVYTPIEVVSFMTRSAGHLLEKHFGKSLEDKGVQILDPCTGTGVFISQIICQIPASSESQKEQLLYKYQNEIHANEVDFLPYYIANINIEDAMQEKMGKFYEYENLCLVDTLENDVFSGGGELFGLSNFNDENLKRVKKQNGKKISLIIGNPPYNANQQSENDNNKNKLYPLIDKRIKESYIDKSTAQKTKQYDMYKRFIRWASDRIDGEQGVVAFITNSAYLEGKQDDGFRACVEEEFDEAYFVDLKGNAKKKDKAEGGSIFKIMVGTGICFLIKKEKKPSGKCKIHYVNTGDGLSGEDKLFWLQQARDFEAINFQTITPTDKHQWLNVATSDFYDHIPLIDKRVKGGKLGEKQEEAIFRLFSLGVATNRDDWAYDFDRGNLEKKVNLFKSIYDRERKRLQNSGYQYNDQQLSDSLDYAIKWSRDLKRKVLSSEKDLLFNSKQIFESVYRPFSKRVFYGNNILSDVIGQNGKIFPTPESENLCLTGNYNALEKPFSVLVGNRISDLHFHGAGTQVYVAPLWAYDGAQKRQSNVTQWAMGQFKAHYGHIVSAEDIFYYCYAVMSAPSYREKYALDLKVDYPRIPLYDNINLWITWGKELTKLHTQYEALPPSPDVEVVSDLTFQIEGIDHPFKNHVKVPIRMDKKRGVFWVDRCNYVKNIPERALEYKIGARSALEWLAQYSKPPKLTPEKELHHKTLVEAGLDYFDFPAMREHLLDLVPRLVAVSLRTVEIYDEMGKEQS